MKNRIFSVMLIISTVTFGQSKSKTVDEKFEEVFLNQENNETSNSKTHDMSGISYSNDEEAKQQKNGELLSEKRFSGLNDINRDLYVDPNSISPSVIMEKHRQKKIMNVVLIGLGIIVLFFILGRKTKKQP